MIQNSRSHRCTRTRSFRITGKTRKKQKPKKTRGESGFPGLLIPNFLRLYHTWIIWAILTCIYIYICIYVTCIYKRLQTTTTKNLVLGPKNVLVFIPSPAFLAIHPNPSMPKFPHRDMAFSSFRLMDPRCMSTSSYCSSELAIKKKS